MNNHFSQVQNYYYITEYDFISYSFEENTCLIILLEKVSYKVTFKFIVQIHTYSNSLITMFQFNFL